MRGVIILTMVVLAQAPTWAQGILTGVVTNARTGEVVGGASIRVAESTRGTYTNARGEFRLPLPDGAQSLVIRSLGYQQKTIRLADVATSGAFAIEPSSVGYDAVRVLGEITPEEVIKRASDRVQDNADRITTLVSTLYSKMRVRVDGLEAVADDSPNESITETFSQIYDQRQPEKRKHVRILQRRQTKNIAAGENMAVFDQFFDFTTPEIRIMETRLVTPLSPDALDEYQFILLGKEPLGDLMVYRIAFEPKARMYPGFEGTITIVEGTYQVIAAEFAPTDETAFPFVKGIRYTQRYERATDSIWVPMYQEITASAGVMVLAGILEVEGKVNIETWVTDVTVNQPIADSLLTDPTDSNRRRSMIAETGGVRVRIRQADRITSVAPDADSSRPEFWETHAFAQQSPAELDAYRIADSIATASPKPTEQDGPRRATVGLFQYGPIGVDLAPFIDRTSITGWRFGAEFDLTYDRVKMTLLGTIGERDVYTGEIGLDVGLIDERGFRLALSGSVFSQPNTVQPGRTIFGRVNFLNLSNVIYAYWSDYYRADGFDVGFNGRVNDVRFNVVGTWARHFNMPIIDAPDREVVRADAGEYQTLAATVSIAQPTFFTELFGGGSPIFGSVTGVIGREKATDVAFATLEGTLSVRQETFATGYYPMRLDVDLTAGTSLMSALPRQYQFTFVQRYPVFGTNTAMATVPINAFGGTEYVRAHVEHNFSDIWWRAIGLPVFGNKRGIDLIGIYDAGQMWQDQSPLPSGSGWDASRGWYQEAGFGLGRIPTFISDLFYLRFDALWPVGGLQQQGSFGWSITLSSPLL